MLLKHAHPFQARHLLHITLLTLAACGFGIPSLAAQSKPRLALYSVAADSVRILSSQVYLRRDTTSLEYDLYLPGSASTSAFPVVILFNNDRDLGLNVGWARLLAASGFAAVLYDSDERGTVANFDALVAALELVGTRHRLSTNHLALLAGSGAVGPALTLASDSMRSNIRAAVMLYGSSPVRLFRADLPVLLVRSGLDQPQVMRAVDSLAMRALAMNAPFEIINHPSGEHPFEEIDSRAGAWVLEGTIAFLRRSLSPAFDGALASERLRAEAGAAAYAGDWSRAARAFKTLAEAAPSDPEMQRRLGDARLAAGDATGAIPAYLRARELRHWRRGDITVGLMVAYAQSGQREQAFTEIANLPSSWNKAEMLARHPQLAALRNDPDFVRRMR